VAAKSLGEGRKPAGQHQKLEGWPQKLEGWPQKAWGRGENLPGSASHSIAAASPIAHRPSPDSLSHAFIVELKRLSYNRLGEIIRLP
jgi:hypothetical protein